jgi:hypothetical protein
MKRFPLWVAAGVLLLLPALPLNGQDDGPGMMAQVLTAQPIQGHANALEAGATRHMEWYGGSGGGAWTWAAFEIAMGDRTGQYVWFSGSHTYADFDTPDVNPAESAASIAENITPHLASVNVMLGRFRPDLSLINPDAGVRPLYEVLTFTLKGGADDRFEHFLAKVREAFGETGFEYSVYQAAQGGNPSEWVVSIPHDDFASMGGDPGDFPRLMSAAHGEYETRALLESLGHIVASQTSEVFVFRPDLSVNIPGS